MNDKQTAKQLPSAEQAQFRTIGLLGTPASNAAQQTFQTLSQALHSAGYTLLVAEQTRARIEVPYGQTSDLATIGKQADLAIVVGGDGNMLGAARELSQYPIGVIGVNRGNLGFLTDLDPKHILEQLAAVLLGRYTKEERFLLEASITTAGQSTPVNNAMNEVVLHSDKVAHMIEFEVFVDNQFVFSQRSDGLIIATPTGSTAYSLSAGGSILHPAVDAINLIPMFPHTLSSRPLVVPAQSQIKLRVAPTSEPLHISCDGHNSLPVPNHASIHISKQKETLTLIHPLTYNYFRVLRNKLDWGRRLF